MATDDTIMIVKAALYALKRIYREGYAFMKAGVMLMDLCPRTMRQATLFDDEAALTRRARLMTTMDSINREFGRGAIRLASSGTGEAWKMRQSRKSPSWTTNWHELPRAKVL
ncbi:hypothetical protein GCM10027296_26530 [Chitinimonas naiadis]